MNLGTPRRLLHAAAFDRNPEVAHHAPAAHVDPVERIVVVEKPAVPDHVGDLVEELDDELLSSGESSSTSS